MKTGVDIQKVDGHRSEKEVIGMKGAKYKVMRVEKGIPNFVDRVVNRVTAIELQEL
jgi:hypothetical protein